MTNKNLYGAAALALALITASAEIAAAQTTDRSSPSHSYSTTENDTAKRAMIRCLAVGGIAGVVTFLFTFEPNLTAAAATGACVVAAGEEAVASEIEKRWK